MTNFMIAFYDFTFALYITNIKKISDKSFQVHNNFLQL